MAKVIESKMYIAVDPKNNHNKFWKYERYDAPISGTGKNGKAETGDLKIMWGRVGDTGESQLKPFNEKWLASKIREKTNKSDGPSYTEVAVVGESGSGGNGNGNSNGKSFAKEEIKKLAVKEIAGGCPITSALVKKLAEVNRHEIIAATGGIENGGMDVDLETGIVRTALGVVTSDAVKEARKLLGVMTPYVKKRDTENTIFTNALGQYLRLVPQKVERTRGWYNYFIDINKQTDLLDRLETSVELAEQRIADAMTSAANGTDKPVAEKKAVFNVSLKLIDDAAVVEKVKKLFYGSVNRSHSSSRLKPVRVYEVDIPSMKQSFEMDGRKVGNVKLLWHGTRMFNVLSILKRGFVLPSQLATAQVAGAMYGPGMYFSDQSTKSLNYSYGGCGIEGRETPIAICF